METEYEDIRVAVSMRNIQTGATVTAVRNYPAAVIRSAHREVRKNPHADTVLRELVILAGIDPFAS